jgi:hypothetical protein
MLFLGQCPSLAKFVDSVLAAKRAKRDINQSVSKLLTEAVKTPLRPVASKSPEFPTPAAARADIYQILVPEVVNVPGPAVRPKQPHKWLQPPKASLHAMKTRAQQRRAAELFTAQLITAWTVSGDSTPEECTTAAASVENEDS